jgi:hypothetical protein
LVSQRKRRSVTKQGGPMTVRATKMRILWISMPDCCSRWPISLDLDTVKRIIRQAEALAQEIGRRAA